MKIRTNELLNEDSENKFKEELYNIAVRYIGEERAQKAMELYQKSCEKECKDTKYCLQKKGESCCDKNK